MLPSPLRYARECKGHHPFVRDRYGPSSHICRSGIGAELNAEADPLQRGGSHCGRDGRRSVPSTGVFVSRPAAAAQLEYLLDVAVQNVTETVPFLAIVSSASLRRDD